MKHRRITFAKVGAKCRRRLLYPQRVKISTHANGKKILRHQISLFALAGTRLRSCQFTRGRAPNQSTCTHWHGFPGETSISECWVLCWFCGVAVDRAERLRPARRRGGGTAQGDLHTRSGVSRTAPWCRCRAARPVWLNTHWCSTGQCCVTGSTQVHRTVKPSESRTEPPRFL